MYDIVRKVVNSFEIWDGDLCNNGVPYDTQVVEPPLVAWSTWSTRFFPLACRCSFVEGDGVVPQWL